MNKYTFKNNISNIILVKYAFNFYVEIDQKEIKTQ